MAIVAGFVVVMAVVGIAVCTGVAVAMTAVVAGTAVVSRGAGVSVGDSVGMGAGCGDPAKNPLRRMYTTTMAMTATAIIPIFFKRRRCFFFRTISLYRSGR